MCLQHPQHAKVYRRREVIDIDSVDDPALIVDLFSIEWDAYLQCILSMEAGSITDPLGMKPTYWKIVALLKS